MTASAQSLKEYLRRRIGKEGPISFKDYMECCLYHPEFGYYTNLGGDFGGDFYTAPEVGGAFGLAMGRQIGEIIDIMGEGAARVIEMGPGTGSMARDALDYLIPRFPRIEWTMVEVSPSLKELQKETLEAKKEYVNWAAWEDVAGEPQTFRGCIVANEFLDALPFRRIGGTGGTPAEIYIDTAAGNFTEVLKEPPEETLPLIPDLGPGEELEISEASLKWLEETAEMLDSGAVLLVDYFTEEIRKGGSVRCFGSHTVSGDPLGDPGKKDITRSVFLPTLLDKARNLVLDIQGPVSQGAFLLSLGILNGPGGEIDFDDYRLNDINRMMEIKKLILPGGMGETHGALCFTRGGKFEGVKLGGFGK